MDYHLFSKRGEVVNTIAPHRTAPYRTQSAQEDDIAALWRTLQDRGLCSLSPINATASAATASTAAAAAGLDPAARNGGGQAGIGEGVGPRKIDIVLHSVAHAPTEAMRQGFLKVRDDVAFFRCGCGPADALCVYLFFCLIHFG